MNNVVHECKNLTQEDITFLEELEKDLGILADLSRADVLMYCPCPADRAVLVAQARPHSILPIHGESMMEQEATSVGEPAVMRALSEGRRGLTEVRRAITKRSSPPKAAPVVQETYPIQAEDGPLGTHRKGARHGRHRRRSKVFQRALRQFQQTVMAGQLHGAEDLTPFAEHDGVLVIDTQHRIQYVSGIATNLYRKLGYAGTATLFRRRAQGGRSGLGKKGDPLLFPCRAGSQALASEPLFLAPGGCDSHHS